MCIRQKLKEISLSLAKDFTVKDVRIGLGYTAVLLDNGQAGVAYTFHTDLKGGCTVFDGLRPLAGRQPSELLAMFDSTDKLESTLALATCNALGNTMENPFLDRGDILKHLKLHPGDRVGMVGNFAPLVPMLRKKTSSLKIFEQIKEPRGDLLPETQAYTHLPRCQVTLITSTSIINHTIDDLLDAAQGCREVILLGASTPLISDAFSHTPATILSGIVVINPEGILRTVSEGAGMRHFGSHIKKVNMKTRQP